MSDRSATSSGMPPAWSAPAPPSPRPDPPAAAPPGSSVPAAAWVAAVGAALLLLAAGVLVVGSWNTLRPEVKLIGLLAVNGTIAAAATTARRAFPVVSRALAHLAAMLTVPSGVAVMATAHRHWPAAIVLGGGCGVVAGAVESRRWRAPKLELAAEAAAVLAAAGVAAMTDIPLGMLVVALAVVALIARRDLEGARFALVAGTLPALSVLGSLGVGPGTMVRLGARGPALVWEAPVAAALAAAVLITVAARRRTCWPVPAALAHLMAGSTTGLAQGRADGWWFAALPAAAVLLGMAAAWWSAEQVERGGRAWLTMAQAILVLSTMVLLIAALWGLPLAIWWARSVEASPRGATTVALWALAALTVGSQRRIRGWWSDLAPLLRAAGAGGLLVAAAPATGDRAAVVLVGLLLMVGAGVVLAVWPAARTGAPWHGLWLERAATAVASAAMAAVFGSDARIGDVAVMAGAVLVAIAAAAGTAIVGLRGDGEQPTRAQRRADRGLSAALAAICWLLVSVGWPDGAGSSRLRGGGSQALGSLSGWQATAALGAALLVLLAGRLRQAVAVGGPVLAAVALTDGSVSSGTVGLLLVVAAAVLTGMALAVERWTPLDTAAVSATIVAALVAYGGSHWSTLNLAALVFGVQGATYGLLRAQPGLQAAGATLGAFSLATLPLSSGLVPWLLDELAPHGVSGTDVAVALIGSLLLGGGVALRRAIVDTSSWIAYGPALALGGLYLLSTEAARPQDGRVATMVGVGVVAVAVGGWRRLAAPLLMGTALMGAAVVQAAGHRLASLPVWVWLAACGAVLLGVALLIEQRGDGTGPEVPPGDGAGGSLLASVWRRFS